MFFHCSDTLLSSQILKSPVSSQKSSSPRKSTRSSPKKPVDGKKVPIWKSEPKPEPLRSKPGDVYDIEYDPKDVKQKRKRRPKTSEPAKRAKKQRIEPENLPPIELKLPGEEKSAKTNKAVQKAASPAPQCLQPDEIERLEEEAVLPERPSTLVLPLDESIVGPSTGGCPASTPINTSTPFMNEQSSMAFDPITPIVEVRVEVAEHQDEIMFSSNAVEVEQAQCKPARPHLSLDNCFGFDEPEEEPQTAGPAVMKSTPLRAPRAQANAPFRPSPSPVRKVVDSNRKSSGSRPARLDRNLARDIVGIHPVGAAQDRKKQKTLKEFVEETEPVDRSYEEGKREYSPPTPPTVFTAVSVCCTLIDN